MSQLSQPMWSMESMTMDLNNTTPSKKLFAPLITSEQRSSQRQWRREYRRKLTTERKAKREADGVFEVDLRAWLKAGILKSGVNVLTYKDVEGEIHSASLLPTGKLQYDCRGGPVFNSTYQWLNVLLNFRGPRKSIRLQWESRRVEYRGKPMTHWFRTYREWKKENPSQQQQQQQQQTQSSQMTNPLGDSQRLLDSGTESQPIEINTSCEESQPIEIGSNPDDDGPSTSQGSQLEAAISQEFDVQITERLTLGASMDWSGEWGSIFDNYGELPVLDCDSIADLFL